MEAIEASPIFMIVLSPHALDRCVNADDWVRREIEYALERGRHFIPVNPDLSFDGFPADLPDSLKAGLGQHQFSEVMFGQLFMASVDKMVRDRIEPLLQGLGRAGEAAAKQTGALFHVETDTECRILKFGREIAIARPGADTTIRLLKGRHKLEAVSTECPDDRLAKFCTVEDNDMEDILTVELLPVRDKRLQAEAAERKAAEETVRKAEAESLTECAKKAFDAGDPAEAVTLWRKAAEMGDSTAQYNMGRCHEFGCGVLRSRAEAKKWYGLAADNGSEPAKKKLAQGIVYRVGDYYNENGKEGVVFEVDATGRHGKIVGMKQTKLPWAIDKKYRLMVFFHENPSVDKIYADDYFDGMANMQKIMRIDGWREKYPAFAWCAAQGDGWYLPARSELGAFTIYDKVRDAANRTLSQYGGDSLVSSGGYWSSTEYKKGSFLEYEDHQECAYTDSMCGSRKNNYNYVRAVSAF